MSRTWDLTSANTLEQDISNEASQVFPDQTSLLCSRSEAESDYWTCLKMNSPSSPLLPHTRPCPSSVVSRNSTYTHWPNQELGRNLHSFLSLPLSPLNPLKYLLLLSKCLPEPSRLSLSWLPLGCWNDFSNRMIQLWSPGQNLQGVLLTYRTNLRCPVWYTRHHLRFGPAHVPTCPVVFPALPHTVTSHQILMLRALYQGSIPLPALFSLPNHRPQLLYLGNSCSSFTP